MPNRDLSIGKHPLIIGRTWPKVTYHWTHTELQQFLDENRYPAHTWGDQQNARKRAAVAALRRGNPVPQVVLDEDPSIVEDFEQEKGSDALWSRFNIHLGAMKIEFEKAIGFLTSMDVYRARVTRLLLTMFKQRNTTGVNKMQVKWEDWELTLRAPQPHIARSRFGFSAYGRYVVVAMGADSFGISGIHTISWDIVDSSLFELLKSGQVSYDDIWFFTGVGWTPLRASVVTVVEPLSVR